MELWTTRILVMIRHENLPKLIEVIAVLNILPANANLATFQSKNVCLLYLLSVVFKQVNMFKPFTRKEGNLEVYVISQ